MAANFSLHDPQGPMELPDHFQVDVAVERVAAVYAEAFLGAAEKSGRLAEQVEEFDSLVADVLDRFPALEQVLASSLVSPEEKTQVLDRALSGQATAGFLRFLKVLARHGRLDVLRAICRETHALYDRKLGRVRVEVTTAVPLGDGEVARIVENLRPMLGAEPLLEQRVDPNTIGGIVIRVGDTIYDASVANQLQGLRQQIIDRSAHEIQSRRDRFRHPAGN